MHTHKRKFRLYSLYIVLLILLPTAVNAQLLPDSTPEQDESVPEWPADSLGRRTPRGTVYGFFNALADERYERASYYLNLNHKQLEEGKGAQFAQGLKRLLDKGGEIIPYSLLSNDVEGRTDDNLLPSQDRIGTVRIDGQSFALLVEEIKGPDGGPIWLFSVETLDQLMAAPAEGHDLLIDRLLPPFLKEHQIEGVSIGQWLIMLLIGVLAYFFAWTCTGIVLFVIRKLWAKAATEPTAGILKAFALPVRIFFALWLFLAINRMIGISILVRQWFSIITVLVWLTAIMLLLWRLTEFIGQFSEKRLAQRGHVSGISAVLFLKRLAKISIIIFGFIFILGIFGVDVTTGLAALGIGGIALALGAQKTIENFVGSVTLIADQPIRVGDFCKAGDTIGTVEEIGMRSTRIRTLDRTLVTIPNGEFSSIKIENYTHRDRFRLYAIWGFRYETTADQLRYLLVELRSILYAHPKVDPEPARVRFKEYGAASLDVEIFAYIMARDFNEFTAIREDLLLRMMDVVEKSGTGFAFPSQTLYMARDKGLSEEKTKQAEEQVKQWRDAGEMQLPAFDPQRIRTLKNSLSYPPDGSAPQSGNTPN